MQFKLSSKPKGIASIVLEDLARGFSIFLPTAGMVAGSFWGCNASFIYGLNPMATLFIGGSCGIMLGVVVAPLLLCGALAVGWFGDGLIEKGCALFRKNKTTAPKTPATQQVAVVATAPVAEILSVKTSFDEAVKKGDAAPTAAPTTTAEAGAAPTL